ncbi:MAG: AAA family ATPase [Clostridiales Family XIII bacterium]|jgi:predicted AAA+ superfamily ATPase|nr:AAA family ATPase [Clostridiales Family XIII bacterium]
MRISYKKLNNSNVSDNASPMLKHFLVGSRLQTRIQQMTGDESGRYKHRDFVEPLIDFCLSKNYNGKIGIVYGLRSTGKTVGMLQAAETMNKNGYKPAYARFNYDEAAMGDANIEISALAKQGYTHFFIDEATYLEGFLNGAADWSDEYVPDHKIKIIIAGTDSFLLNIAKLTSLFHRYEQFSTNWCSFAEFSRIQGSDYEQYRACGGIFTPEPMPDFIQSAIVENLVHSLRHCVYDANRSNAYSDSLAGINAGIIYTAIVSILKCTVEDSIKDHFIEYANEKNTLEFGSAVSKWTKAAKWDIRRRVAEAMSIYSDFQGIDYPESVIETLINVLVQIGCLLEASGSTSGLGEYHAALYYFSHPALMSYAVEETVNAALRLDAIDHAEFESGIRQAAEGFINESIVFSHILHAAGSKDRVFRYRDADFREVDIVVKNFEKRKIQLIEVKSKSKIDEHSVFVNEAKHLYDDVVLANLGINNEYEVTRVIVYGGESKVIEHQKGSLIAANIKSFIGRQYDRDVFLSEVLLRFS